MSKKRILVICYSWLNKDPRVIRQIQALQNEYDVETIGYSAYDEHTTNYQIKPLLPNIFLKFIRKSLSYLHAHSLLNKFLINQRLKELPNFSSGFDLIICNDLYPLPLAHKLAKKFNSKLLADLHEYYPAQGDSSFLKKWEYHYYVLWLCKKLVPKADFRTTVCNCVSEKYKENFRIEIDDIITNATAYNPDNKPSEIGNSIKLVHHGVASSGRNLVVMMNVMKNLPAHFELHFYLVASSPDQKQYLEDLKSSATKDSINVYFHEPVATQQLSKELNKYDIGFYILPPNSDNNYCALPNKIFEFIQARLAIAVSPNPEMAKIVNENGLGVVSKDFSAQAMAEELRNLTTEQISTFKAKSHENALPLSALKNIEKIQLIVSKLI